jgi:hypothetical protein
MATPDPAFKTSDFILSIAYLHVAVSTISFNLISYWP